MRMLKRSWQEYLVIGKRLSKVCLAGSRFHVYETASSFGDIIMASCDPFLGTATW